MSALRADVWADLIAWVCTTAPGFAVTHWLMRRHVSNVTSAQTAVLQPPEEKQ